MRYLVTGGLGVVGSCMVRRLLEDGHQVTIWDACEAYRNAWIWANLPKDIEIHRGRIEEMNVEAATSRLREVDAVIHAAASTGIPHSVVHPDDDWRSNVDATRVLLEALRKHPVPTVILSSVKPYAVPMNIEEVGGLTELVPLIPDEPYAASKAAQSMLAMAYARSYELPIVTFRCSNLYGPAPCHGPRHGWLTWFCISAAIGRPIEVQGTGEQSRDMLHADDVLSACLSAFAHMDKIRGEVFNIGGGANNRVTVGVAAERLREIKGVEIVRRAPRAMDDLHVFANFGAFKQATGWVPRTSVDDGIRSVLLWAIENKVELAELYREV